MSFYSYKNANTDTCPGNVSGNVCNGLNERVCIQVKNVYDACLQQQQLNDVTVTISDIVPVLSDNCCGSSNGHAINCNCNGNSCNCNNAPMTYNEAAENAAGANCLPRPVGNWTFESCRSSATAGTIRNLTIDRLCDRPQFARIRGIVDIPIDVLFVDANCQEWMGRGTVSVVKDVLLAIPDESIVPFTLESLVSAICVTGTYIGNSQFKITICVTVVLKILAEVELMIPTYGFCQIPPCEEFAESVCDEFFSLPLFPQQATCLGDEVETTSVCSGNTAGASTCTSTCSNCGTTCLSGSGSLCPRCGCAMTNLS